MKTRLIIFLLSFLLSPFLLVGQEANEEPSGENLSDQFSLEGALTVFKDSKDLEDFEKRLNQEDNYVNNLDINEDGEIDYIRVEDHMEGNVHAIIIQAAIGEKDAHDIAVIEIEKTGEESAQLQIVGDEDIYGEDYIIEPFEEEASSGGKGGPSANYEVVRVVVNVWFWSPIRVIYRPSYRPYISPYYWGYYPRYWKPWRPLGWSIYSGRRAHFKVNFRVTPVRRVVSARRIYTPVRRSSTVVRTKTTKKVAVVNKSNGTVKKGKVTKSTTKVKGRKGGTTKKGVKKTKTTTKVKGKNGKKGTKVKKTKKTKVKKKRG